MFTVKDFCNLKVTMTPQIITARNTISKKTIEHISVIETPVDDFVKKNELVLTTAKDCSSDEAIFNLINEIYLSGAAAVVIARPSNNFKLSEKLKVYFEKKAFPIIIMLWEVRFADVLDLVLKNIRGNILAEINFYENIQSQLLKSYLNNEDLSSATKILQKHFKSDIAILDVNYEVRGYSNKKFVDYQNKQFNNDNLTAIQSDEKNYGYLYFENNDKSIIINSSLFHRYFLNCLILWFDREWIIYTTQQNAKDKFVAKLTKNNLEPISELSSQAVLLGFNLNLPYTCIVGKLQLIEDELKLVDWIYDKWQDIQTIIIESASNLNLKTMFTYKDNSFIIYLSYDKNNPDLKIHKFLDNIENNFLKKYQINSFTWGISEINNNHYCFNDKYENAKLAQKLCVNQTTETNRYTYKNTITHSLINLIAQDEKLVQDLTNSISPLIEYDAKNSTELLYTLKIFLQSNNASTTAKKLHLHRQSLLKRLAKIEEISKLSLKDYEALYLLETALRLYYSFNKEDD
jgi:purine catabolism regulator